MNHQTKIRGLSRDLTGAHQDLSGPRTGMPVMPHSNPVRDWSGVALAWTGPGVPVVSRANPVRDQTGNFIFIIWGGHGWRAPKHAGTDRWLKPPTSLLGCKEYAQQDFVVNHYVQIMSLLDNTITLKTLLRIRSQASLFPVRIGTGLFGTQ